MVQGYNSELLNMDELQFVTDKKPTKKRWKTLFCHEGCKAHQVNGMHWQSVGKQLVGPGQTNRIMVCNIAIKSAEKRPGSCFSIGRFLPVR